MVVIAVLVAGLGLAALVVGSVMIAEGLRELVKELRRHRASDDTAEMPPILAEPKRPVRGRW